MRGELLYVHNPNRIRLYWAIFWSVLLVAVLVATYQVAAHVRTHTAATGQLSLAVPYTKYTVGEEVAFSLTNSFNTTIFVSNECPSEPLMVYRQINNKWVRIHDSVSQSDCKNESRTIAVPSNGVVTGSFAKWKNLFAKPGKYRIVAYVEYYNALPYQDIEIIEKPTAVATQAPTVASSAPVLNAKSAASGNSAPVTNVSSWGGTTTPATAGSTNTSTPPASTGTGGSTGSTGSGGGSTTPAPKTVTITVNSSGKYSVTNLVLNAGDTLTIQYSPVGGREVQTVFTRTNGTTASISSMTVDSEVRSRSRTLTSKGTWRFTAPDIGGSDVGNLTVQ